MHTSNLENVVDRFKTADSKTSDSFERIDGGWPEIHLFIEPVLDWENQHLPEFSDIQNEGMTVEYERLIRQEMDRLSDDERPMDLLILVPGPNTNERRWASAALTRLGRHTDYTVDENRRANASPDAIRLCTYHSARGLEGMRVLIFGIERMPNLTSQEKELKSLGYIALSRSLFETTIIIRGFDKMVAPFLNAALDELRKNDKDLIASAKLGANNEEEEVDDPLTSNDDESSSSPVNPNSIIAKSKSAEGVFLSAGSRKISGSDSKLIDRYMNFISNKDLDQRVRIQILKQEWLRDLASAEDRVRLKAVEITKRTIRSPKLQKELAEVLEKLVNRKSGE